MTRDQIIIAGPELVLAIFTAAILMTAAFVRKKDSPLPFQLAVLGLGLSGAAALNLWMSPPNEGRPFAMMRADRIACFFDLVFVVGGLISILVAGRFLNDEQSVRALTPEFYALILLSTAGMMIMASSNDLLMVFLGLETLSIALYVLAGFARSKVLSIEASLKYFLLGAFATGFLIFGMALIFAATATTDLTLLTRKAMEVRNKDEIYVLYAGIALLLVGLAFKVALVPFHQWTPDVYEGSPTPVTAFMSVGSKAAGFAATLRVFGGEVGFATVAPNWDSLIWLIAVMTMTLGNVVALHQQSLKRMLGYSGIAHAGYVLVGFLVHNDDGAAAVLFYLMAYSFMNLGAFTVIVLFGDRDKGDLTLQQSAGLAERHLPAAIAMMIFMISLAGIPLTAGFFAKFYLFSAALSTDKESLMSLTVIAVLNSVVSVYYYLRPVVMMFMRDPTPQQAKPSPSVPIHLAMLLCLGGVVGFGLYSHVLIALARGSIVNF